MILSQQAQGHRQITHLPLMIFITKAMCLTVRESNYSSFSPYNSKIITISKITTATATSTAIGHTYSKEVEKEGERYNMDSRGY